MSDVNQSTTDNSSQNDPQKDTTPPGVHELMEFYARLQPMVQLNAQVSSIMNGPFFTVQSTTHCA